MWWKFNWLSLEKLLLVPTWNLTGSCYFDKTVHSYPIVHSSSFPQYLTTNLQANIFNFSPYCVTHSHQELKPDCPDHCWDSGLSCCWLFPSEPEENLQVESQRLDINLKGLIITADQAWLKFCLDKPLFWPLKKSSEMLKSCMLVYERWPRL